MILKSENFKIEDGELKYLRPFHSPVKASWWASDIVPVGLTAKRDDLDFDVELKA